MHGWKLSAGMSRVSFANKAESQWLYFTIAVLKNECSNLSTFSENHLSFFGRAGRY